MQSLRDPSLPLLELQEVSFLTTCVDQVGPLTRRGGYAWRAMALRLTLRCCIYANRCIMLYITSIARF